MKYTFLIVLFLLLTISSHAQAITEIEGVIKLATTENGEQGTIRYDSTTADFQGYDGNEWKTFLKKSGGSIPLGAVPVHCNDLQIAQGQADEIVCRRSDTNELVTPVGADQYIIINTVVAGATVAGEPTGAGFMNVWRSSELNDANGNTPEESAIAYLLHDGNYNANITSDLAPLMILNTNDRLYVKNFSGDFPIFVGIRGFLTTSVQY